MHTKVDIYVLLRTLHVKASVQQILRSTFVRGRWCLKDSFFLTISTTSLFPWEYKKNLYMSFPLLWFSYTLLIICDLHRPLHFLNTRQSFNICSKNDLCDSSRIPNENSEDEKLVPNSINKIFLTIKIVLTNNSCIL
jgi:hypothetical protein